MIKTQSGHPNFSLHRTQRVFEQSSSLSECIVTCRCECTAAMKSSQLIRIQHSCAAVVSNEDYQYLASAIGCEALPMKSTQIDPFSPQCKCCAVEFNKVPNAVLRTDTWTPLRALLMCPKLLKADHTETIFPSPGVTPPIPTLLR